MKSYEKMAEDVFKRIDEYEVKRMKNKNTTVKIIMSVSCICLAALIGIGIWKIGFNNKIPAELPQSITSEISSEIGSEPEAETPSYTESEDESYGGTIGNWFIPCFPFEEGMTYTGERITDGEAQKYFKENKNSIVSTLSASGVSSDSIKIAEKGYCHAFYDGTEGKLLEVRLNFRDYLVYNGDKLVAIITLTKEDGKISGTPMLGAKWFGDYNKFLQSHKGEELVFAYATFMEIVVAPNGEYINPMGYDLTEYLKVVKDVYKKLYCDETVYIP